MSQILGVSVMVLLSVIFIDRSILLSKSYIHFHQQLHRVRQSIWTAVFCYVMSLHYTTKYKIK